MATLRTTNQLLVQPTVLWRWLHVLLALTVLAGAPLRARAEPPPPQWIVVTAPAFRAAIEPLCQQRKSQGMQVRVVTTSDILTDREVLAGDAVKVREQVARLCRAAKGPSYVLLVGAVEPGRLADPQKYVLPPLRGTTGRMKGQPSDNGYGCLEKDLLPTVAVGRMPARTPEEAAQMVRKTLAFERDDRPGEWRRRLTILAGIPAFNPWVDKLVEGVALARFDRLDPSWSGRAIYHNAQSRFTLPDDRLHDRALDYVQAGQAFTVYLGHSDPEAFYAGRARFLDREDWGKLSIPRGAGIFATFGCLGCQLAGRDGEGYGLAAMRNPAGPVAVLGSHGICFAAMVQLAADGFFESTFTCCQPPERLGEAWLRLKAGLANGKIDDLTFRLLDSVDGDSKIPQATQRLEHLEMFVLLGDPALRLPVLPGDVAELQADAPAPGKTLTIAGKVPPRLAGARVRLTLERPLTSTPLGLQALPKEPAEQRSKLMLANHDRANQFVLETRVVIAKDGRFEVRWPLPEQLPWPRLLLRAYAVTEDGREGLGTLALPLER